ncbi:hypothetical protein QQS21_000876 [Conoideocrella luteorostrata]|uniref:cellulase n=1 Tax=Conoideocrella luteorostrata TaxID=1105319 RepID=A0AAJ0D0I7_9HYPO|nr:hypothetical protein QQS21_000876 [Conoideocrella luteorostrata]
MHLSSLLLGTTGALAVAAGRTPWAGVNLFGLANDVSIMGSAYTSFVSTDCKPTYKSYPYLDDVSHYKEWRDKGFNLFRIAIAWQHAQEDLFGALNETNIAHVEELVEAVHRDGNTAIINIHNYARWYCAIIDQPERSFMNPKLHVTNEHFTDLWTKLAQRFKKYPNVIFQLMNEPHDLDMAKWAVTNQQAILAIRNVTQDHAVLVSGTQFARLSDWVDFSAPWIGPGLIQDPANKTMYDFHQYFDGIAGAYGMCETWRSYVRKFEEVTQILRKADLHGMLTEFGGGPFPQCRELITYMLSFLARNSDVWQGWTAWGSFNPGALYLSTEPNSTFYAVTSVLEEFAPKRNTSLGKR